MRAVGIETLAAGSLSLCCRGSLKIIVVPMGQWASWCEQQSGVPKAEISLQQLIAAFKAGKFDAPPPSSAASSSSTGPRFQEVYTASLEAGAMVWVPPGFVIAQKLTQIQADSQAFLLRRLFFPQGTKKECENLEAVSTALARAEGDIHSHDAMTKKLVDEVPAVLRVCVLCVA